MTLLICKMVLKNDTNELNLQNRNRLTDLENQT